MDVSRLIETALELIDRVGTQALTLRMLAHELDSGTATIYRHVASKDDLLALVADRILGEIPVASDALEDLPWREAVAVAAAAFYETLCRHPNALPLLAAQVPVGPNALRARERMIQLLLDQGFSPDLAARSYTALGHYVLGFALQQHGPGAPRPEDQNHLRAFYRSLDPDTFPATKATADELTSVPLDEEFRFGLNLLLDGLEMARQ